MDSDLRALTLEMLSHIERPPSVDAESGMSYFFLRRLPY